MGQRSVLVLTLAVVVGAAVYFWRPSEERRVRTRVEAMAAAAGSPANEDNLSRLARARRLIGWMRDDVRVDFEQSEWPPIVGRDAVAALVARPWPQAAVGVTVELQDLTIRCQATGPPRASASRPASCLASPRRSPSPSTGG